MTFFIDNCLSYKVARMLKALGEDAVHLTDEYPAEAKDLTWIPEVSRKGYIIITSDREIRRVRAEADALTKNGAIAFFMPHAVANMKIFRQAEFLCKSWPNIKAAAEHASAGDIFDIRHGNAKVERRSVARTRRREADDSQ